MLNKTDKILVIVESATKSKSIAGYLKKAGYTNAVVMASIGHVMELANDKDSWKNTGIWPEENFRVNIRVNPEKHKLIADLKSQAARADKIFVATDPDREGHVIAWSLCNFLELDMNKTYRMVTHEITPKAVVYALENPIPFDNNMVDAGLARWVIDKLLGYGLTPWAKLYVGANSVGRVISIVLRLATDREKEIRLFIPEKYFDIYLNFIKNNVNFKAKYIGTTAKPIDRITSKTDADNIINSCINNFKILDIKRKEKKENPKPPFDTPTFLQEANSKLRLKTKDAQSCAQKLFEGVEINGQHVGLVTYIRTDDTHMSPEFVPYLKNYIESNYGMKSFNTPRVGKKAENAQEGHECLRVTDPTMTPEKLASHLKNDLLVKVYRLIWQRTIACAMPPATISETTYLIENNNQLFSMVSNEIVDPGYRTIYSYRDDDEKEDGPVKESFNKNEILSNCSLEILDKETKPKPRYTEATINKEIQKRGLCRPSTLSSTIDKLLSEKLNFCKLDGREIVPTELGMATSSALERAFPDLISYTYTSEMEERLDLISDGKLDKFVCLNEFYNHLTTSINNNTEGFKTDSDKICPECGAKLVVRRSKFKKMFLGCSGYPKCHHIENI